MHDEAQLYYFADPAHAPDPLPTVADSAVEILPVGEFLADEPACKMVWELVDTQFRTRSKFLAVWRTASLVVAHRDAEGAVDGFLIVTSPVNWQIDYVVVRPDARGQGVAGALIRAAMARAKANGVPYVMLTSKASLRPLYEACGFEVVRTSSPATV